MINEIDIFKALGEENRFRAVALLVKSKRELCACELIAAMEKPQYTVSKSMGTLVSAGIVEERRDGKMMFYRLRTEDSVVSSVVSTVSIITGGKDYQWKADFSRLPVCASSAAACRG